MEEESVTQASQSVEMRPAPARAIHTRSGTRPIIFKAIIFLALFAAREVVLRFLFPMPEIDGFNRMYYVHGLSEEIKSIEPMNERWIYANDIDGFSFVEKINLYGFRGEDFPATAPAGRKRVVFLGDSYAEGIAAKDGDTIPEQFQRIVHVRSPVECINLGVSGNNLDSYVCLARDAVPLLKPDHVVVVLCWNDLPCQAKDDDECRPRRFRHQSAWTPRIATLLARFDEGKALPFRFPVAPDSPADPTLFGKIEIPEGTDPAIVAAVKRGAFNPAVLTVRENLKKRLQWDYSSRDRSSVRIEQLKGICDLNHCMLTLVYIPSHLAVNPSYHRYYDQMTTTAVGRKYGEADWLIGLGHGIECSSTI